MARSLRKVAQTRRGNAVRAAVRVARPLARRECLSASATPRGARSRCSSPTRRSAGARVTNLAFLADGRGRLLAAVDGGRDPACRVRARDAAPGRGRMRARRAARPRRGPRCRRRLLAATGRHRAAARPRHHRRGDVGRIAAAAGSRRRRSARMSWCRSTTRRIASSGSLSRPCGRAPGAPTRSSSSRPSPARCIRRSSAPRRRTRCARARSACASSWTMRATTRSSLAISIAGSRAGTPAPSA